MRAAAERKEGRISLGSIDGRNVTKRTTQKDLSCGKSPGRLPLSHLRLNGTKTPPLPVSSHVWLEMAKGAGLVRYWLASWGSIRQTQEKDA